MISRMATNSLYVTKIGYHRYGRKRHDSHTGVEQITFHEFTAPKGA